MQEPVEAVKNTIGERTNIGSNNSKVLYLGTRCPYPADHPCTVLPHPENNIVLNESSIVQLKALLDRHKEKLDEYKEQVKQENQTTKEEQL